MDRPHFPRAKEALLAQIFSGLSEDQCRDTTGPLPHTEIEGVDRSPPKRIKIIYLGGELQLLPRRNRRR